VNEPAKTNDPELLASLPKTARALRALSQCCQALVQTHDEPLLLERVCQIIVGAAGYRLAWVGLAESDASQTVRPVAQAGFEQGYLQKVNVTWADVERGRGPTGTAVRTSAPCVIRDTRTDPRFAPWRDEALRRGYASCAGLPLVADGVTLGAITIYAPEPNALDDEELALLQELADNLAYGMMALRTRAAQQQAEELLRQSHQELEVRVEVRTRELAAANERLRTEIAQRKQAEEAIQREQSVLRQLLEVYENHRQLVAYEIHDGVVQSITGALMNLEATLHCLPREAVAVAEKSFVPIMESLRAGLAEARRLMAGLRPALLDESGLLPAIQELVDQASKSEKVNIECSLQVEFDRLASPLESAVFRMVQEALTNACRYSRCRQIRVALTQHGETLRIEVQDEGVGFDPNKVDPSRFGLQGIRERARLFGGTAVIQSAPGRGTRITVELPIVEAA
jgi:signal transduction histidine kinase